MYLRRLFGSSFDPLMKRGDEDPHFHVLISGRYRRGAGAVLPTSALSSFSLLHGIVIYNHHNHGKLSNTCAAPCRLRCSAISAGVATKMGAGARCPIFVHPAVEPSFAEIQGEAGSEGKGVRNMCFESSVVHATNLFQ
jgi:hypothetical protein